MEENPNKDLAQGSFIEKWPTWLRWLLFIPSAIVIPAIFLLIQMLFQTWFLDIGKNAFLWVLMRGAVYGGGFVFVGTFVAPKNQRAIAIFLLIIVAMLVGIGILSALMIKSPIVDFIEDFIMICSAGYVTYHILTELN